MSIECGECEMDLRSGHELTCSRNRSQAMTTDKAAAPVGAVPQDLREAIRDAICGQFDSRGQIITGQNTVVMAVMSVVEAALASQAARMGELEANDARYRWLRDPVNDVALVIDKVVGAEASHEGVQAGGYRKYEYRAGDELDAAIDALLHGAAK